MIKMKHFQVFLVISILLIGFSNCGGAKSNDGQYTIDTNPPFLIGDVYSQDWVAGIPSGGSGTNLYVTFESFTDAVMIDQIYFRKKKIKAQNSPQYRNQYVGYFKDEMKPDVIMDIDPVKEARNTPPQAFPFDLKDDEAVIGYLHEDEMKYAKFGDIREEEMLSYPQSRPDGID